MALCLVPASVTISSASTSAIPIPSRDARRGLSNGTGVSACVGELINCGLSRSSESWGRTIMLRRGNGKSRPRKLVQGSFSVRASLEKEAVVTLESAEGSPDEAVEAVHAKGLPVQVLEAKGLEYEGPGKGGQWLSSTTRHVRIYIGVADPVTKLMDQTQLDKITLMLDPDNEFIWPQDKVQKVYDYFAELVEGYAGAPCTEYTLRLIGSDIEHYIRKLLLGNEIKYNLDCRVLNFSMGKPRYESGIIEEAEE